MHADTIFVLEKGKITEKGKHQELLEQKGLYYAMWRQQIGERDPIVPVKELAPEQPDEDAINTASDDPLL
jgi:ATP-binding cassette subfamily B protein